MVRRTGRGVLKGVDNHVQDVVWPLLEIAVPDPQHAIATRREPTRPDFVAVHLLIFRMLAAVQLNDQLGARTEEIGNVGAHRVLAAKAVTGKLFATEKRPQSTLVIRHVPS